MMIRALALLSAVHFSHARCMKNRLLIRVTDGIIAIYTINIWVALHTPHIYVIVTVGTIRPEI